MKAKHLMIAVVAFVTMIIVMTLFERSLIFFPTRYPDGLWDTEAAARGSGCTIDDQFFTASDGVQLHGWWCRRLDARPDQPVLLFFHGNAGNLSHRAELLTALSNRTPASVFVVGYRGYGRSEGRPTEDGLYTDARAAWSYLTGDRGVDPGLIVIFGKSLGGAVAVDLAVSVPAAGLIVESSFTSIREMAKTHYPFVPRFLVATRMDSIKKIPAVACPKLFIHSKTDEVVPFRLGRELFGAAGEPKRFHEVVGSGHNETWIVGGEPYFDALSDFVDDVTRP
ncbi:MAG: alpha/beta hydrolase [Acidobacteria bacterium]|nr:alpha/beta hydrolase [Acidobacteriota bacterium]